MIESNDCPVEIMLTCQICRTPLQLWVEDKDSPRQFGYQHPIQYCPNPVCNWVLNV